MNHPEFKALINENSFTFLEESKRFKHILSHQIIHAKFWKLNLRNNYPLPQNDFHLVEESRLETYAMPRLADRYLKGE